MANVRFYRLETLPSFDISKHVGIFVHVTTGDTTYKAGLWFGGTASWEYLTNDTNAINAAIDAKIAALDVEGYAQATITTNEPFEGKPNSTLTILGIQEVDGIIGNAGDAKKLDIVIDGAYNGNDNKIATQSTVTNAINGLNVDTIQAVTTAQAEGNTANTVLTFNGIKEEKGKIKQGDGATTFTVGDAKLKIQIGSSAATNVFSANATADSTIQLDGLVFRKNDNNEISVITPTAVTSSNRLVTEKDVANLAGAMHYKGTVSSLTEFQNKFADSDAKEAGDVYIATGIQEGSFNHNGNTIENGDMIVFNSASEYKVVQSNITLGTGSGLIAANSAALSANNLVVASATGIETIEFDKTNLTDTTGKNERTLSVTNGTVNDNGFHHAVTITDTFKVIGKDFSKSITITSNNRSIDIANNGDTGVMVDLVWNTTMDGNN